MKHLKENAIASLNLAILLMDVIQAFAAFYLQLKM
jgi:hypothetical protein